MTVWHMLLVSLAINGFFFIGASFLRTDVFTDITYSLSFVLLALVLYISGNMADPLRLAVTLLVTAWGLRLGSYLFIRILTIKVDHRFDDKRDNSLKFGIFWLFQAVVVWAVMLPVYATLSVLRIETADTFMVWVFIPLALAGLLFEAVADQQKFTFKAREGGAKSFMNKGLWKFSRHPNYFGEIVFWWSISIPVGMYARGLEFLYLVGPVVLTSILLFVSGIPLLEKSADKKWGSDPLYAEYKKRTSILIPLPRKRL